MQSFVDVGHAELPCSCSGLLSFQVGCASARSASFTVELRVSAPPLSAVQLDLELGGVQVSWSLAAGTSWQNFTSPSLTVGSEQQVLNLRASTQGLQIRWVHFYTVRFGGWQVAHDGLSRPRRVRLPA